MVGITAIPFAYSLKKGSRTRLPRALEDDGHDKEMAINTGQLEQDQIKPNDASFPSFEGFVTWNEKRRAWLAQA